MEIASSVAPKNPHSGRSQVKAPTANPKRYGAKGRASAPSVARVAAKVASPVSSPATLQIASEV